MSAIDDRAMEEVARYFSALAVTMRLKILDLLRDGEKNVSELTAATGCTQANVSKHLAVLAQCGFVEKDARGTSVYYRIADPAIYGLCDTVCGRIAQRYAAQAGIGAAAARRAARKPARKPAGKRPAR